MGRQVDVTDAPDPCPQLGAEGEAGDLFGPRPGRVVVVTGEAEASAALR